MNYDPERHHRRSVRLSGYDYSQGGVYFFTACTYQRQCLLGSMREGQVEISPAGRIVTQTWEGLPDRFPDIILDEFVVMPNHIHGILVIADGPIIPETGRERPTLGAVLRAFKSLSAVSVNRLLGRTEWPLWQRNYHEKIIRSEQMLEAVRRYVQDNPRCWTDDADNPNNV
jgi:REP element-mobilizing transposase RayT